MAYFDHNRQKRGPKLLQNPSKNQSKNQSNSWNKRRQKHETQKFAISDVPTRNRTGFFVDVLRRAHNLLIKGNQLVKCGQDSLRGLRRKSIRVLWDHFSLYQHSVGLFSVFISKFLYTFPFES